MRVDARAIGFILLTSLAWTSSGRAGPAEVRPDLEARLRAAEVAEVTSADLTEAIQLYEEIAGSKDAPPAIRARALVRLAACEKARGNIARAIELLGSVVEAAPAEDPSRVSAEKILGEIRTAAGAGANHDWFNSLGKNRDIQVQAFRLATDLASSDAKRREAAEIRLRAMGPVALPVLRKLVETSTGEVRARAARVATEAGDFRHLGAFIDSPQEFEAFLSLVLRFDTGLRDRLRKFLLEGQAAGEKPSEHFDSARDLLLLACLETQDLEERLDRAAKDQTYAAVATPILTRLLRLEPASRSVLLGRLNSERADPHLVVACASEVLDAIPTGVAVSLLDRFAEPAGPAQPKGVVEPMAAARSAIVRLLIARGQIQAVAKLADRGDPAVIRALKAISTDRRQGADEQTEPWRDLDADEVISLAPAVVASLRWMDRDPRNWGDTRAYSAFSNWALEFLWRAARADGRQVDTFFDALEVLGSRDGNRPNTRGFIYRLPETWALDRDPPACAELIAAWRARFDGLSREAKVVGVPLLAYDVPDHPDLLDLFGGCLETPEFLTGSTSDFALHDRAIETLVSICEPPAGAKLRANAEERIRAVADRIATLLIEDYARDKAWAQEWVASRSGKEELDFESWLEAWVGRGQMLVRGGPPQLRPGGRPGWPFRATLPPAGRGQWRASQVMEQCLFVVEALLRCGEDPLAQEMIRGLAVSWSDRSHGVEALARARFLLSQARGPARPWALLLLAHLAPRLARQLDQYARPPSESDDRLVPFSSGDPGNYVLSPGMGEIIRDSFAALEEGIANRTLPEDGIRTIFEASDTAWLQARSAEEKARVLDILAASPSPTAQVLAARLSEGMWPVARRVELLRSALRAPGVASAVLDCLEPSFGEAGIPIVREILRLPAEALAEIPSSAFPQSLSIDLLGDFEDALKRLDARGLSSTSGRQALNRAFGDLRRRAALLEKWRARRKEEATLKQARVPRPMAILPILPALISAAPESAPEAAASAEPRDALRQLAEAEFRELSLGDIEGAEKVYTEILADPTAAEGVRGWALRRLAGCAEKRGEVDRARTLYAELRDRHPTHRAFAEEALKRLEAGTPSADEGWFPSALDDPRLEAELYGMVLDLASLDAGVRAGSASRLRALGPLALPLVRHAAILSCDPSLRREAAALLAAFGDLSMLNAILDDPDAVDRLAVIAIEGTDDTRREIGEGIAQDPALAHLDLLRIACGKPVTSDGISRLLAQADPQGRIGRVLQARWIDVGPAIARQMAQKPWKMSLDVFKAIVGASPPLLSSETMLAIAERLAGATEIGPGVRTADPRLRSVLEACFARGEGLSFVPHLLTSYFGIMPAPVLLEIARTASRRDIAEAARDFLASLAAAEPDALPSLRDLFDDPPSWPGFHVPVHNGGGSHTTVWAVTGWESEQAKRMAVTRSTGSSEGGAHLTEFLTTLAHHARWEFRLFALECLRPNAMDRESLDRLIPFLDEPGLDRRILWLEPIRSRGDLGEVDRLAQFMQQSSWLETMQALVLGARNASDEIRNEIARILLRDFAKTCEATDDPWGSLSAAGVAAYLSPPRHSKWILDPLIASRAKPHAAELIARLAPFLPVPSRGWTRGVEEEIGRMLSRDGGLSAEERARFAIAYVAWHGFSSLEVPVVLQATRRLLEGPLFDLIADPSLSRELRWNHLRSLRAIAPVEGSAPESWEKIQAAISGFLPEIRDVDMVAANGQRSFPLHKLFAESQSGSTWPVFAWEPLLGITSAWFPESLRGPAILELTRNGDPETRKLAISKEAAIHVPPADFRPRLLEMRVDPSPEVRAAVASAIGRLKDAASASDVVPLLADSSADVRLAAAESVRILGPAAVIPTLLEHLDDPDPRVQDAVLLALEWTQVKEAKAGR